MLSPDAGTLEPSSRAAPSENAGSRTAANSTSKSNGKTFTTFLSSRKWKVIFVITALAVATLTTGGVFAIAFPALKGIGLILCYTGGGTVASCLIAIAIIRRIERKTFLNSEIEGSLAEFRRSPEYNKLLTDTITIEDLYKKKYSEEEFRVTEIFEKNDETVFRKVAIAWFDLPIDSIPLPEQVLQVTKLFEEMQQVHRRQVKLLRKEYRILDDHLNRGTLDEYQGPLIPNETTRESYRELEKGPKKK